MYALNFYSPMVADQLRSGRKSATIRLGDKSGKYKKGMVVQVLCGVRFGARERVFDAVIDKVEVKTLGELSPREIEHDNPEIRRTDEMAHFLGQLYNREVAADDVVTVIRFSQILNGPVAAAVGPARTTSSSASFARAPDPRAEELVRADRLRRTPRSRRRRSTRTARRSSCSGGAARRRTAGTSPAPRPRTPRTSAARRRSARQTATQSPSTLRRSSRSQSEALPTAHCSETATRLRPVATGR